MNTEELIEKCKLTDEEILDAYYDNLGDGAADHTAGYKAIAKAQLRKVIPIIQKKYAEIAELKEQIEYMHEAWEVLIEVTEAECQEKIARIRRELEEMFEPTVPMSLDYEKWHAYWEKKGVK